MSKRILITGATGGIGKEVLAQLYHQHNPSDISVLVRNSRKTSRLLKPFSGINIIYGDITDAECVTMVCADQDFIIHLAAVIPPLADEHPIKTKQVNVEGTRNIIQGMKEKSPDAFLLFSSSVAVYGDRLKNPGIRTTDDYGAMEYDAYGQSKIEAEQLVLNSQLNWSIFRLSAIMGIQNHKMSKIMFHMPLETEIEIATVRDTARALVNSISNTEHLNGRLFNLGGGEACRITYLNLLKNAFKCYGLGKVNFSPNTFAKINFHCGHYLDGDELEEILHFRKDTNDSYFKRLCESINPVQKILTLIFKGPVKFFMERQSEPLKAQRSGNPIEIKRFFG